MSANDQRETDSHLMLASAQGETPARREQLQNQVFEKHLDLARRLARRYRGRGVPDDDLEQVARLGLLQAVRRFDVDHDSFTAYAVPTILGELRRYFRDHAWTVRPTRHVQEVQASSAAARDDLRGELSREPTSAEVAARIGESEHDLREADAVRGAFAPRSLDAPAPGEATPFGHSLGVDDPHLAHAEDVQAVGPAIRRLSDADRRLLHLRYVEARTQTDIGLVLGISQMQVSRRLSAVIARIRDHMGLEPVA
jgi:RNA polymerase sigma-B factor